MELPPHCACCDADQAGEVVVESGKDVVGGLPQVYTVDVSYCRECRRHLRRPGWRIAIFILALPILFYAGWRLNPVRPESFLQTLGLGLAIVVAARALSYVLIPRFGVGRKHGRESRSLWVRNFDAERVTLAVCHAGYQARIEGNEPLARTLLELRRRLSALIFGGERPVLPLLRPLLTLGLAVAALTQYKPITEEARALRDFRSSPSMDLALRFAQHFPHAKHRPEIEDYLWSSILASPSKAAYQAYLRVPQASRREEAKGALADLEVDNLIARPDRAATMKFIAENPNSTRLPELRKLLFDDLTASAIASELAPPLPVLRRVWAACPTGRVPVTIRGFSHDDYRQELESRLKVALRAAGLDLTPVEEDAILEVDGESGKDRGFGYSKFGLGGSGPFAEYARATIRIRFGDGSTAWVCKVSAKSPQKITYTTYGFGGGSPIDTGPSQHDVHAQTLPVWIQALAPLFQYRP